jgi:hypothetical protein
MILFVHSSKIRHVLEWHHETGDHDIIIVIDVSRPKTYETKPPN